MFSNKDRSKEYRKSTHKEQPAPRSTYGRVGTLLRVWDAHLGGDGTAVAQWIAEKSLCSSAGRTRERSALEGAVCLEGSVRGGGWGNLLAACPARAGCNRSCVCCRNLLLEKAVGAPEAARASHEDREPRPVPAPPVRQHPSDSCQEGK